MAGFDNEVVYGSNVDFSGNSSVSGQITTDGQLLIGTSDLNAGGTHINVGKLTSPDNSVIIGYSSPNITLKSSATGSVTGPGSSTVGDIVLWNNTSGTLLSDAGFGFPLSETRGGTGQSSYTTGNILYASATNTLSKLPIATIPGQFLNFNGTNVNWFNPLKESILFDDFITSNNSPAGNTNWTIAAGGTGSSVSTQGSATDSSHPGTVQINTGTTTTGSAQIRQIQGIALGGGILSLVMVVKVNNLSDGTETYQFVSGLNGGTGVNPADGVYFTYSDSGASPNWIAATASSSSRTTTDTGVAVTTNWTTLQININAAGSSITYYIANSLVATITTNIPTARIGPFFGILKSAGTTSRTANVDMMWLYQNLTSTR